MREDEASRTAVLVCQGRAVAHGRLAVGRFEDPTAMALLRDDERAAAEQARADAPPDGWSKRIELEMQRANAATMVPRTVSIDDAVLARLNPQLVILGAGLDGRAWRMPDLADVDVFEVDHPVSQQDKRSRVEASGLRPVARSVHFVPVDLTHDALGPALVEAGYDDTKPTTWIWEGVVAYLTPAEVRTTVSSVADWSAPGSRLIVSYGSPSPTARLGRLMARGLLLLSSRRDPAANEPRRSSWTPESMRALLAEEDLHVVRDDALRTVARELSVPIRNERLSGSGRVAVADGPGAGPGPGPRPGPGPGPVGAS